MHTDPAEKNSQNGTSKSGEGPAVTAELAGWIESNRDVFIEIADAIWEKPEVAWKEFEASKLQADFLTQAGFDVTWDLGGINTAFVAEWGSGKPVIGFIGEYDALPGLSQKRQPKKEAVADGAPGHGCGHNLLGTGCLAATVAVKEWMDRSGMTGTVRYYGCPAEERITGKTFMARAGTFDDLDAALNYHPGRLNTPSVGSAVGCADLTFGFHGKTAHAGGSPHLGRSALDAVELMNVGVNYLREHVTDKVRLHYATTRGGEAPNIVPEYAEVWYYVRAHEPAELQEVIERVRKVAQGAAMMTETSVTETFSGACSSVLNNRVLAELQYEVMQEIGSIEYSSEEIEFAQEINANYPAENAHSVFKNLHLPDEMMKMAEQLKGRPLIGENFPPADDDHIGTGSTDVGDVSRITPLSMLETACFATGASGHSWGITATSGMSIGHKGMLHAAKIMAAACARLITDPDLLRSARSEFEKATDSSPYAPPLPDGAVPPRFHNPARGVD